MALKQTAEHLRSLLHQVTSDLEKAEYNKAASQRVRTGTIKLEKIAKLFRKESIKYDKSTKGRKKPGSKAKPAAVKKHAVKKAATKEKAATKKAPAKKVPPKKTTARKTTAKGRAMSVKKRTQTAKLPTRRASH